MAVQDVYETMPLPTQLPRQPRQEIRGQCALRSPRLRATVPTSQSSKRSCTTLVLSRREGEALILNTSDGEIVVSVELLQSSQVKVGSEAPQSIRIMRDELV